MMQLTEIPLPDSSQFRFVTHPLFARTDASEQLERLRPADWEERDSLSSAEPVFPTGINAIGKLCKHPLLSREAERYLFLRMNYEKFAAASSEGKTRETHVSQSLAARNRILLANARLLVSIAGQFASSVVRSEDLISEGMLPLMRAVELFDVSRGWAFATYATHVLRNHYRRAGQQRERKNRFAAPLKPTQLAGIPDESVPASRQEDLAGRHHQLVQRCLSELPATDQIILRSRFGFDQPASPKTRSYAEVGQLVGLSKERVRVRTHRALEQLRETVQERRWEFPELENFPLRAEHLVS